MGKCKSSTCITFNVIILLSAFIIFTGCQSTRGHVDGVILEYQRQITELEARLTVYERTARDVIDTIEKQRDKIGTAEGTVDELICLMDDYQRTIEQLLRYYRQAGTTDK